MSLSRLGVVYAADYDVAASVDAGADGSLTVLELYRLSVVDEAGERRVTAGTDFQYLDSVEVLSDGSVVVARGAFAFERGNAFTLVDASLSPASRIDGLISDFESRNGTDLIALSTGGFMATYVDLASGTSGITFPQDGNGYTSTTLGNGDDSTFRVFDAAGQGSAPMTALSGTQSINGATTSERAGDDGIAGGVQLVGGEVVLGFRDTRFYGNGYNGAGQGGGYSTQWTVSVQIGGADGDFGSPIQVNTDPFDTLPYQNGDTPYPVGPFTFNSVVALPDGGFAVIWHEDRYTPGTSPFNYTRDSFDTMIRYYDPNGTARTGEITMLQRDPDTPRATVYAEALPDGRIAFAWNDGADGRNGNGSNTAFLSVASAGGGTVETLQVSPTAANMDFFNVFDLAVRSDGSIDVAWLNDVPTGPDAGRTIVERFAVTGLGTNFVGGTTGADVSTGTSGVDQLFGAAGDDQLSGLGGADKLFGGPGNDGLAGGEGEDLVRGGVGNAVVSGGGGNDTLDGGRETTRSTAEAGSTRPTTISPLPA